MTNLVRTMGRALGVMLASSFLSAALLAQTSGGILTGQVKDQAGLPMAAVTVTLTGAGGAGLVAQTNEEGKYVFRNLPAGTYSVRIDLKGFATFEKTGIVIAPGKPEAVDAQMQVSMEKENVNVQSEASTSTSTRRTMRAPWC